MVVMPDPLVPFVTPMIVMSQTLYTDVCRVSTAGQLLWLLSLPKTGLIWMRLLNPLPRILNKTLFCAGLCRPIKIPSVLVEDAR